MHFNNNIPFEDLYQSSLKEASRKKPVFFIHKYFARRITANFRIALLDYIYDDNKLLQHFYEPFILSKCYPVQSETRTGAHTSGKNSIGIDIMLVSKKIPNKPLQLTLASKDTVEKALHNTRTKTVEILDRFQKVSAELTAPDIQNIAIALFFTELPDYYAFDENSKTIAIDELQNLLINIESVAGDFEITKKRNGWWSELYRQKWKIQ